MKKTIVTLFSVASIAIASIKNTQATYYVSASSGWNAPAGYLGVQGAMNFKNYMPFVALGYGQWGMHTAIGSRYFFNPDFSGHGISLSLALAGLGETTINGAQKYDANNTEKEGTTDVTIGRKMIPALNLAYVYNLPMGKKGSFLALEAGYSIALSRSFDSKYTSKNSSGENVTLSDNSKYNQKLLQPGGIILGIAYHFGL